MTPTRSLFVDPSTGDLTADAAGGFVACTPALAAAISATMTIRGSVAGLPDWGFSIDLLTHRATLTARRVEAEVDRVLRPLVGSRVVRYEREAWLDSTGVLRLRLLVVGLDGEESTSTLAWE